MRFLENDEIKLRAIEPEDLSFLYAWENHSDWWHLGATLSPYSHYTLKEYIANAGEDIYTLKQLRLMIVLQEQEDTIGMIDVYDFDPFHKRAGIGILIAPEFQKSGYGNIALCLLKKYLFEFLRLHQLYVHIPVGNEASIHLFVNNEFYQTGCLKDWLWVDNQYTDVLVLQCLNVESV